MKINRFLSFIITATVFSLAAKAQNETSISEITYKDKLINDKRYSEIVQKSAQRNIFNISRAPADSNATDETKELYQFLMLQFEDRIISGQTHNYYNQIKNLAGKSPLLRVHDFQHFTEGYPYLWANGGHTFGKHDDGSVQELINWYNSTGGKGIISYQWHWHSPSGGEVSTNTFYTSLTDFDIREAVKEGTGEYNDIIRDIDDIAAELKKFQDEGIPILWRPLHEAGGGWFWWGAHGAGPCLELYDILFDRLKNHHHLHNLIWVWSTPEEDWYPGNDKVDIIGHDSYPGSHNYDPQKEAFDRLFDLTNGEKLIAMTENGPIPDPGECFKQDAPWLFFMSWNELTTEQNSVSHIQEVFDNPMVLTIESANYKTDNLWRSSLYPEDWRPGYTDEQGRFLHDFSYAGYHQGEKAIPEIQENIVDVSKPPYNVDNTGSEDATTLIQDAINKVGESGGGVVYFPAGKYKIKPQNGSDYSLRISDENIILRGAGADSTFLFNDEIFMRQKNIILIKGEDSWWFSQNGAVTNILYDLPNPTKVLPVESMAGFAKGDKIIIASEPTDEFIEEHKMSGIWTASAIKGVAFYREIDSIDATNKLIFIDSPTRYFLKTRDHSKIYHANSHIQECGIENLSIGNRQSEKTGWDEESYSEEGTGAYDVHFSQAIQFKYSENCWIKNVSTYRPDENADDFHILSNCLLLNQCRNITVDSCFFQKPQYEGGGGNGYMYTLCSNDCLIKNSRANHSRHNYDFKYPYSNGNVIHNCSGENSKYASDFHMYLSMSNLFDVFTVNGDYLESCFRPYGGDAIHGYSSTQSVFYNTIGEAYHPQKDYIVESRQFGWGYIIGTSGQAYNIVTEPVSGTTGAYSYDTSPEDFVEGANKGDGLRPWSLYLDQLQKRLDDSTAHAYNLNVVVRDGITLEPLSFCNVKIYESLKETGEDGVASFTDLPESVILYIDKDMFYPVEARQITIFNDTTVTFYLSRKEHDVRFQVFNAVTTNAIWGALVTVDSIASTTGYSGEAEMTVYEGEHTYTIQDEAFQAISGIINIISDTTLQFYLVPTSANVKFRIKKGTTPINKATVIMAGDTLISNSLGIVNFYNLAVGETYNFSVARQGYFNVNGEFVLHKDTTINIQMEHDDVFNDFYTFDKNTILWPNPVKNILHIKFATPWFSGKIIITDLSGNILYLKEVKNEILLDVHITSFSIGVYILKTINQSSQESILFIKQ